MNDLISRAAAIAAFDDKRVERNYGDVSPESVIRVIESIPAVKAQEPVEPYGQYSVHTGTKYIVCGACEKPLCMMKDSYRPKYCPECGRMVKWHANEAEK